MTDIILSFLEGQDWWVWVSAAIAAASAFTPVTPTPERESTLTTGYPTVEFPAPLVNRAKHKAE